MVAVIRRGSTGRPRRTAELRRRVRAPLPQRDYQPVEVGGDDQSGLAARQREHRAVLIGQHDRARAGADRGARAGRAIDAINIRRRSDVADGADEIDRRGAKSKAVAHPADRESITPAVKYQRAAASGAANDKASLEHVEADCAAVGVGGSREPCAGHGQSNQRGTNGGCQSHGQSSLNGRYVTFDAKVTTTSDIDATIAPPIAWRGLQYIGAGTVPMAGGPKPPLRSSSRPSVR